MDDKYDLVELDVERTVGIKVTFADNYSAEIDLMTLRLICPCAMCRSLREKGKAAWPQSEGSQKLSIRDAQFHGSWGVNITWSDGHNTGIYTFQFLRENAESHLHSGLDRP
jgi:DUF971 family protein